MFWAKDAESPRGIGALWAIIFGMSVVVILLLRVGNSIFNREELLGRMIDEVNFKGTFRKIWQWTRAINPEGDTARNIVDWYRHAIPFSLKRLGASVWVTIGVFTVAFIVGFIIGQLPQYQLPIPDSGEVNITTRVYDQFLNTSAQQQAFMFIFTQNARILLAATILAAFSFGVMALVLTPAVYAILGYVVSQAVISDFLGMDLVLASVVPHGIVEIPIIVLATAAAFRLGAVITRPPENTTVGHVWTTAMGDTLKIGFGLILPGLLLAAFLEVVVTPRIILAVIGG
jgi:uncharacterized membrane protein SpoIIM required for sporulation